MTQMPPFAHLSAMAARSCSEITAPVGFAGPVGLTIPVHAERVTVERVPVVREEIAVAKRTVEDTQAVVATARHEEAVVETRGGVVAETRGGVVAEPTEGVGA